jgi:hypothetical protein
MAFETIAIPSFTGFVGIIRRFGACYPSKQIQSPLFPLGESSSEEA